MYNRSWKIAMSDKNTYLKFTFNSVLVNLVITIKIAKISEKILLKKKKIHVDCRPRKSSSEARSLPYSLSINQFSAPWKTLK